MPDISGFTQFIHETEIRHSQHIISELLEIMIDSNDLNMELAEIEGDALFYYIHNRIPDLDSIIAQVKKMYLQFHHHLQLYEHKRICQCGACSSASKLQLKFVTHAGYFSLINIKGQIKPFGPSVISIHRLLKNDIPSSEYVLFTDDLIKATEKNGLDRSWKSLQTSYDNLDPVKYYYQEISAMKDELPKLPEIVVDKMDLNYRIRLKETINREVLDVYELITNFNLRMLWNKSANKIEYDETEINQVNSKHTCVIDNKDINFSTITQPMEEGKWVYGEQTSDVPFMSRVNTYFILAPEGNKTSLLIDIYFNPSNFVGKIFFQIFKKKFRATYSEAMYSIKEVAEKYSSKEMYKLVET